jgi:hypothetical protein
MRTDIANVISSLTEFTNNEHLKFSDVGHVIFLSYVYLSRDFHSHIQQQQLFNSVFNELFVDTFSVDTYLQLIVDYMTQTNTERNEHVMFRQMYGYICSIYSKSRNIDLWIKASSYLLYELFYTNYIFQLMYYTDKRIRHENKSINLLKRHLTRFREHHSQIKNILFEILDKKVEKNPEYTNGTLQEMLYSGFDDVAKTRSGDKMTKLFIMRLNLSQTIQPYLKQLYQHIDFENVDNVNDVSVLHALMERLIENITDINTLTILNEQHISSHSIIEKIINTLAFYSEWFLKVQATTYDQIKLFHFTFDKLLDKLFSRWNRTSLYSKQSAISCHMFAKFANILFYLMYYRNYVSKKCGIIYDDSETSEFFELIKSRLIQLQTLGVQYNSVLTRLLKLEFVKNEDVEENDVLYDLTIEQMNRVIVENLSTSVAIIPNLNMLFIKYGNESERCQLVINNLNIVNLFAYIMYLLTDEMNVDTFTHMSIDEPESIVSRLPTIEFLNSFGQLYMSTKKHDSVKSIDLIKYSCRVLHYIVLRTYDELSDAQKEAMKRNSEQISHHFIYIIQMLTNRNEMLNLLRLCKHRGLIDKFVMYDSWATSQMLPVIDPTLYTIINLTTISNDVQFSTNMTENAVVFFEFNTTNTQHVFDKSLLDHILHSQFGQDLHYKDENTVVITFPISKLSEYDSHVHVRQRTSKLCESEKEYECEFTCDICDDDVDVKYGVCDKHMMCDICFSRIINDDYETICPSRCVQYSKQQLTSKLKSSIVHSLINAISNVTDTDSIEKNTEPIDFSLYDEFVSERRY